MKDFAPGACPRGTLQEQSSSVCTNDFMGILHPREQNFHPAKCSTIFNRLNAWEQAPGAKNAPSCVLTRAKWSWSTFREQNPSCVSAFKKKSSIRSWSSVKNTVQSIPHFMQVRQWKKALKLTEFFSKSWGNTCFNLLHPMSRIFNFGNCKDIK